MSIDKENFKKIKRYTTDFDAEEVIIDGALQRKTFKHPNKRTQNLNRVFTGISNKTSNNRISIVLPSLK